MISGFSCRRMLKGPATALCCRCFAVWLVLALASQSSFSQAVLGDWTSAQNLTLDSAISVRTKRGGSWPPSRTQGLSFGSYCAPLCAPQSCCSCWLLRPLGNHAKTIAPGVAGSGKAIEVTGPHHRGIGCCRWEYQVENFFGMVPPRCMQILLGIYERLLVAQRHHGIDSGRAAGGNVTSEKGSREQRHCHRTQGDRIDGAHSIEQAV